MFFFARTPWKDGVADLWVIVGFFWTGLHVHPEPEFMI